MPQVLPDGSYRLSVSTGTEPYYIALLPNKPDTIGIIPGDVNLGPIFALINVGGDDEYNIMLGDRWIDENENGEICLDLPVHKKWKIVPAGANFMIKGGQGSCWSPVSLPQNPHDISIKVLDGCSSCTKDCYCMNQSCGIADCFCDVWQPENIRAMVRAMLQFHIANPMICSCSGCPPPCLKVDFAPA